MLGRLARCYPTIKPVKASVRIQTQLESPRESMKQRSAMVNLRNYPAVTKRKEGFDEEKEKEEDELVKREVKRNKTGEELIGR